MFDAGSQLDIEVVMLSKNRDVRWLDPQLPCSFLNAFMADIVLA
jgi:hypothetical protein